MPKTFTTQIRHIAKGGGAASGRGGSPTGSQYTPTDTGGVTEARLSELLDLIKSQFLSRVNADTAEELITFLKGIASTSADISGNVEAGSVNTPLVEADTVNAGAVDADTVEASQSLKAPRAELADRLDMPSRTEAVTGLTGQGCSLWIGSDSLTHLDVDILTVRQSVEALQFKCKELQHVGMGVVVSPGAAKVQSYEVTNNGTNFWLVLDDMTQVATGDLLRCSRAEYDAAGNLTLRSYWMPITFDPSNPTGCYAWDAAHLFTGDNIPHVGDEVIVMGNVVNAARQGFVMIALSDDDGGDSGRCRGRISIYQGVTSASLAGCERGRFGDLSGLGRRDGTSLDGYGVWAQLAVMSGDIESRAVLCPRTDWPEGTERQAADTPVPAQNDTSSGSSLSGSGAAAGSSTSGQGYGTDLHTAQGAEELNLQVNGNAMKQAGRVSPYIATLSEYDDGVYRQYYDYASGGGIRMEYGYDAATDSLVRYYNADGSLRWKQGSTDGLITSGDVATIQTRYPVRLYRYHTGARLDWDDETATLAPLGVGTIPPNTSAYQERVSKIYYAAALGSETIPDGWYCGTDAALQDIKNPRPGVIVTLYRPVWHIVNGSTVASDSHNVAIKQYTQQ